MKEEEVQGVLRRRESGDRENHIHILMRADQPNHRLNSSKATAATKPDSKINHDPPGEAAEKHEARTPASQPAGRLPLLYRRPRRQVRCQRCESQVGNFVNPLLFLFFFVYWNLDSAARSEFRRLTGSRSSLAKSAVSRLYAVVFVGRVAT